MSRFVHCYHHAGIQSIRQKNDVKNSGFTADSGYITQSTLHSLLVIKPGDTLFRMHKDWKPTDTLGKYYKMNNGNYIASIANIDSYNFEGNIICEAKCDGTIIKQEQYNLGMYRCRCGWENRYDGFKKRDNYYIYTTCGTGSAYCGTEIYVF